MQCNLFALNPIPDLFRNPNRVRFPAMKRNWKRYVPSSTLDAIRACKDFAIERGNLSVERIADA